MVKQLVNNREQSTSERNDTDGELEKVRVCQKRQIHASSPYSFFELLNLRCSVLRRGKFARKSHAADIAVRICLMSVALAVVIFAVASGGAANQVSANRHFLIRVADAAHLFPSRRKLFPTVG